MKFKRNFDPEKIEKDILNKEKGKIKNKMFEIRCPGCENELSVPVGKSICPHCESEINLNLKSDI